MNAPTETKPPKIRGGAWRDGVKARAARLRTEATYLLDDSQNPSDPKADPGQIKRLQQEEIYEPLNELDALLNTGKPIRSLWLWFSGGEVEECWRLLRKAEEGLLLADVNGLPARAEEIKARGLAVLGANNDEVQRLTTQLANGNGGDQLRDAAYHVLAGVHDATDEKHRMMRDFRNQLLVLSSLLAVLALLLLGIQGLTSTPLIPVPRDTKWSATATLALVMSFGCIGALFSALPSLSQMPSNSSPFEAQREQALLKVVTGLWSALLGVLVVTSGIAGTSTQSSTLTGLVVLAAVFGAGQEAVTRFADHKAASLLQEIAPTT